MIHFKEAISIFFKGFRRNRVSLAGMIIISISFPLLLICALLDVLGVVQNPIFGAWIYGVLTPLFMTLLKQQTVLLPPRTVKPAIFCWLKMNPTRKSSMHYEVNEQIFYEAV